MCFIESTTYDLIWPHQIFILALGRLPWWHHTMRDVLRPQASIVSSRRNLALVGDGKTHTHVLGIWLETSSISVAEGSPEPQPGFTLKGILLLKSTEQCLNSCLHLLQGAARDRDSKHHICTTLLPQNFGEHKAKESNCKDFYHWTYSTTTKHFSQQYRKQINQNFISLSVKKLIRIPFSSLMKPEGNKNRGRTKNALNNACPFCYQADYVPY